MPDPGTRLWLDRQMHSLGILAENIRGYENSVQTHTESARYVQRGAADATIGLHAAASRFGLDFVPLFQERYDLVIPETQLSLVMPLLETIQTGAFRRSVSALSGYETSHTGEQISI